MQTFNRTHSQAFHMVTSAIAIYLIGHQSRFRTPTVQVARKKKNIIMDADITVNAVI